MNDKATKEEVSKFIEEYNKRIQWNIDIRKNLDENLIKENSNINALVEEYLCVSKLSEEDKDEKDTDVIDTRDSYIYEYKEKDGRVVTEFQAYSLTEMHNLYYWCTMNETEEEYKRRKIRTLMGEINDTIDENTIKINECTKERDVFLTIKKMIEPLKNQ